MLCPACGAPATPIAYGFPGPAVLEASERGEVVLGGCTVSGADPTHACGACGLRFEADRPT